MKCKKCKNYEPKTIKKYESFNEWVYRNGKFNGKENGAKGLLICMFIPIINFIAGIVFLSCYFLERNQHNKKD